MPGRPPGIIQLVLDFLAPPPPVRRAPPGSPATDAVRTLEAGLRSLGLRGITHVRLTRNRTVMVSFRGTELRVHRGYVDAPPHVLRAIVDFVNGRGAVRRRAKTMLLSFPVEARGGPARRERPHPDDAGMVARLRAAHAGFNAERFDGVLGTVGIRVSRRMRSRLGHYRLATADEPAEIVLSRRHIRRDGWRNAMTTLLHEMVHQWQHEQGLPVDHGRAFRDMARQVGIPPRARRAAVDLVATPVHAASRPDATSARE